MADIVSANDQQQIRQFEISIPEEWDTGGVLASSLSALRRGNFSSGLCANIPVICKGTECPYYKTCRLRIAGQDITPVVGQRCPVEIYEIMGRYQWYMDTLNVDPTNLVDMGLIKELIDTEILIDRADRRQAAEADFLEDVTIAINEHGREIRQRQISKIQEFKDKQDKKKQTILQLLNSTRKDKAVTKIQISEDPSSHAAKLLARKRELEAKGEIIEVRIEDADKE